MAYTRYRYVRAAKVRHYIVTIVITYLIIARNKINRVSRVRVRVRFFFLFFFPASTAKVTERLLKIIRENRSCKRSADRTTDTGPEGRRDSTEENRDTHVF